MKVKVKKLHPDAVIPSYSKAGDAGMDLVGIEEKPNEKHGYVEFRTGLSVEIPEGYVGLVFPRSSMSKKAAMLTNSVGVIDSGYRGEILIRFKPDTSSVLVHNFEMLSEDFIIDTYEVGEKIAQLIIMPYPQIEFEEVDDLSTTDRGEGGFGSTGN